MQERSCWSSLALEPLLSLFCPTETKEMSCQSTLGKLHYFANLVQANIFPTSWALAYFLGSLISSRVSGGHLNPVITVSLSLARSSTWSAAVTLVAAQYTGAALAGCLAFLVYWEGITWFEHQVGEFRPLETAQIFSTFPQGQISLISAMFDQFLGERRKGRERELNCCVCRLPGTAGLSLRPAGPAEQDQHLCQASLLLRHHAGGRAGAEQ